MCGTVQAVPAGPGEYGARGFSRRIGPEGRRCSRRIEDLGKRLAAANRAGVQRAGERSRGGQLELQDGWPKNEVFVQPLEPDGSTNLFVWTASWRQSYELVPAGAIGETHSQSMKRPSRRRKQTRHYRRRSPPSNNRRCQLRC